MRIRFVAFIAAAFLSLVGPIIPAAFAAKKSEQGLRNFWRGVEQVFGFHDTPAIDDIKPKITSSSNAKKVDSTKFYLVEMNCSVSPDTAKLISQGLAIKDETFVSHALWFSDSAGDGKVPTNPAKLVSAFSFEKDANGSITDFQNDTCTETFLLSGTNGVLTVSFSLTDTKSLSGISKVFYSGVKLASGLVPLFVGGPLAAMVTGAAKSVGDTADPIKEIVTALNNSPRRAVLAAPLLSGDTPTIISTPYSNITLKVTPVIDLSSQISKNPDLLKKFYKLFDAVTGNLLIGVTPAAAIDKCASFANDLQKNYAFSKKDNSFLIGYFAQSAFPGSMSSRLDCIGNRSNATDIVQYGFVYNVSSGSMPEIKQEDINNKFEADGYARTPLNSNVAGSYTERLSNLFAKYAQADPVAEPAASQRLLKWIGLGPIDIDDPTTDFSEDPTIRPDILINKLSTKGFKRYGCFKLKPTVGAGAYDTIMLALPLKPSSGESFDPSELLGIRLLLAGTLKADYPAVVRRVQFTRDRTAILEAARAVDGMCYTAKIALPK
jgi:hypothetical protein